MKNITNENELNESSTKSTACYVAGIPFSIKTEDRKLSLGIDEEVINIAKNAGIKISETTQQILKSTTYDPNDNTLDEVEEAYGEFFDATSPLIEKYHVCVDVGFTRKGLRVVIAPFGPQCVQLILHSVDNYSVQEPFDLEEAVRTDSLYEPKVILQNLILAVSRQAKENKKIKELEIAKDVVTAIADDNVGKDDFARLGFYKEAQAS